jgi:hypothetical protein
MRGWFSFSLFGAGAVIVVLAVLFALKVDLALVATVGIGVLCLAWLVALVVLPWNLHFRARHLLGEMRLSERRGIAVDEEARTEARRVASRMLAISIGLHLGSAALLALAAFLFHQPLAWAFAALFCLSTLFRPGAEYYNYLTEKLSAFLRETKVPREDALQLGADLRALREMVMVQKRLLEDQGQRVQRLDHGLQQGLHQLSEAARAGDHANERRIDGLSRKFEETISRLTDNQELIAGVKAFLRLVHAPASP